MDCTPFNISGTCGHEYFVRRTLTKFLDPASRFCVLTKHRSGRHTYEKTCSSAGLFRRVPSPGIEPGSPAPQTDVLSIELREHILIMRFIFYLF